VAVTWYVDSEGLEDPTNIPFFPEGFQLVSLFFRYMNKNWTAKYFEMDYLWLLSGEHFFWGIEPKCTMG
jgi:hypothetical protein